MRVVDTDLRRDLDAQESDNILLAFVTVRHENLSAPLRFVNDVFDYIYGGETYQGILFGFKLLPDGETVPSTDIVVPNVDRRIGQALRPLSGRATVSITVLSSADFDLTQNPRTEVGTARPIRSFSNFSLVEVDHNESEVTGKLILRDASQEQWPGISATKSRLPGLWR